MLLKKNAHKHNKKFSISIRENVSFSWFGYSFVFMAKKERYFKDEVFVEKLSQRIREVRNTHAQTQENLIDNVHLGINKYEVGREVPTVMSILKICMHYKISVREFFDVELFDYPPKE